MIRHGALFGFVECDIEVSKHLHLYFEDMTPFFKNTVVNLEDAGEFMEKAAKDNNLGKAPRRLLTGSFFEKKFCFATPLIQWYLNHGLIITRIYKVVEYTQKAAFKDFAMEVAEERVTGDRDEQYALIAEMKKLEGNALYGHMIMNKKCHHDICYVDSNQIASGIMDPNFYNLAELSPDFFEVEKTKKELSLDLPVHIGVIIFNYAKLWMLQFYYNFIDKYLDCSDFHCCEMDTDSAYLPLAGNFMEELVQPEKKARNVTACSPLVLHRERGHLVYSRYQNGFPLFKELH